MARRVGLTLAIAALLFVVATMATARWGDRSLWPPAPGAPTTEVFIVSHGYHAGIIVPRAALAEQASRRGLSALGYLATRFADFDRLEIGWGDEGFYREVPTAESVTMALAMARCFAPAILLCCTWSASKAIRVRCSPIPILCGSMSAMRALRGSRTCLMARSPAARARSCRKNSAPSSLGPVCSYARTARFLSSP